MHDPQREAESNFPDPVARKFDGVAVTLFYRRHFSPAEGDFQGVAGALSFEGTPDVFLLQKWGQS